MCQCNNNCACVQYDGAKILYTGTNITSPFGVPRGTTFNQFIQKVTNYLANLSSFVTLTYTVNPGDATVIINGEATNSLSVPIGSTVTVTISRSGYQNYTNTFTAPLQDTSYNIVLTPVSTLSFDYLWGEIGNIFAPEPVDISVSDWTNLILPNGTSGGLNFYQNASDLNSLYEQDSTGGSLQWWIIMVPALETSIVDELSNYTWKTYNTLSGQLENYSGTVYEGAVILTHPQTLDPVDYTYSAIRPLVSTKIQFSKNAN